MTLRNQHVKPEDLFCLGDHLNSTGKTVRISVKTFFWDYIIFRTFFWDYIIFFEITSYFGIFSVCFRLHKTGNPTYFSWPRAHFRPPAPLSQFVLGRKWKWWGTVPLPTWNVIYWVLNRATVGLRLFATIKDVYSDLDLENFLRLQNTGMGLKNLKSALPPPSSWLKWC